MPGQRLKNLLATECRVLLAPAVACSTLGSLNCVALGTHTGGKPVRRPLFALILALSGLAGAVFVEGPSLAQLDLKPLDEFGSYRLPK